jgi:hypothetical protein
MGTKLYQLGFTAIQIQEGAIIAPAINHGHGSADAIPLHATVSHEGLHYIVSKSLCCTEAT